MSRLGLGSLGRLSWVELKLFGREPATVVFTFALPLLFLFVLGGVFGNTPDPDVYRGVGAMDFYVPAYIGLVIAAIGLVTIPAHLAGYRELGVLRRFHASSLPMWTLLAAQVLNALAIAAVSGVILTIVAALAFDTRAPHDPTGVAVAFLLSAASFAAIGILLGAVVPTARAAQGAGLLLFFVMFILGGAGPPREVLTDTMRTLGDALPLTYAIRLLQDPWLGFAWHLPTLLVVLGSGVLATVLAMRLFRWE